MTGVEPLLRELAPTVLGVLVRRTGDFSTCEDAVQEALIAAAAQWPVEGVPANPTGWLVTVAARRRTELWRSETARRRREEAVAAAGPAPEPVSGVDDTLTLLMLCCHPALTRTSQVALTLRAVGGLSTAEIARALLVPEATVAQRISRAKASIRRAGARFTPPPDAERADRLAAVCAVLYLVFNEGYTASSGPDLQRAELTGEAIRLARQLHAAAPGDGEVTGLLALMLLTDARRPARTGPGGALVPLAEQDRDRWDAALIAEGTGLLAATLPTAPLGPYLLQAAIAAVHDEAPTAEDTDWPQILALYDLLAAVAPGPMVTLNRLVALAMVRGPATGLAELAAAEADPALAGHHRVAAVRAHLLERAGAADAAREHYRLAAERTLSEPERRYLAGRATGAGPAAGPPPPRGG
ncbi:MAG: RNA polymerase ECF-type sigma factor [uncultured Corynebacteriales bacterium]|uniref:RNA polymerase ECF-type sigma factor n=1 Tax=uncultured Mycobacteriales bacterium TaxID=581187 RepID=A0A6J4HNG5_9ACTN|nr:MAG: RNA polymerase ECF-type sigma factor [uncultured Corynebacteriales bacterium]